MAGDSGDVQSDMPETPRPRRGIEVDDAPEAADSATTDKPTARRALDAKPQRHPFTVGLLWTVLGTYLPGLGVWKTRFRAIGVTIFILFAAGVATVAIWGVNNVSSLASLAVRPRVLGAITIGALLGAVVWVIIIAGTQLLVRPRELTSKQRFVSALAVGLLSFTVAAPLAVIARYASTSSSLVADVFQKDPKSNTKPTINTKGSSGDVWDRKGRLNVLLVGLDNSANRNYDESSVNTDTIMVASINTKTGDTVITQFPRNMAKVPFPKGSELAKIYPDGFYDGQNPDNSDYMANAIWGHVPMMNPGLFKDSDYKGADALKLAMEGATGLKIDYFLALNIDGLIKLIDAMGGVTLNVNTRIPIGGNSEGKPPTGWIEPGPNQKLNGFNAMWYARSRSASSDYDRMGRQTCVIQAVIREVDPQTMLTRYEAIANASKEMVSTDVPQDMLPHLVNLALKVKNGKISRVLFAHGQNGFVTYNPDYAMVRARIAKAIGEPTAPKSTNSASPTSSPSSTAGQTSSTEPSTDPATSEPGGETSKPTSSKSTKSTGPIENLGDACAYNPD